jgi:hypothetical protein
MNRSACQIEQKEEEIPLNCFYCGGEHPVTWMRYDPNFVSVLKISPFDMNALVSVCKMCFNVNVLKRR